MSCYKIFFLENSNPTSRMAPKIFNLLRRQLMHLIRHFRVGNRKIVPINNEVFVEILGFLSRKQLCAVQWVCSRINSLICVHFAKYPMLQLHLFDLLWDFKLKLYYVRICRKTKKFFIGGRNFDHSLLSRPIPGYIRFETIWLFFICSEQMLHDFNPCKRVFNHFASAFDGTQLVIKCTLKSFPTVRHLLAFMRTNLEQLIVCSHSITFTGNQMPRFCTCNSADGGGGLSYVGVHRHDECSANLLSFLSGMNKCRLELYFHFCHYAYLNYLHQMEENFAIDHGKGELPNIIAEEAIFIGNGSTIDIEDIVQWLHTCSAHPNNESMRQLRINEDCFSHYYEYQWTRIVQIAKRLKERFCEDCSTADGQRHLYILEIELTFTPANNPNLEEPIDLFDLFNGKTNERICLVLEKRPTGMFHDTRTFVVIKRELLHQPSC